MSFDLPDGRKLFELIGEVVNSRIPWFIESIGRRDRRIVELDIHGNRLGVVPMTRGYFSIVDPEDIDRVRMRLWSPYGLDSGSSVYAHACGTFDPKGSTNVSMHDFVFGCSRGMKTDHKNGIGLDNRKDNLRHCTHQQKLMNGQRRSNSSSGFKGVSWFKRDRNWRAYIVINARQKHIGYFQSKVEAARAYDQAARELFGEFARLNFPELNSSDNQVRSNDQWQPTA